MSAHVVVASTNGITYNDMLEKVNKMITSNFKISHTTIQLENKGFQEKETHL